MPDTRALTLSPCLPDFGAARAACRLRMLPAGQDRGPGRCGGRAAERGAAGARRRRADRPARLSRSVRPGWASPAPSRACTSTGSTTPCGWASWPADPPVYLFDAPEYFDRPGTPYADEHGREFADNALRFGGFSHAVAEFAREGAAGFNPGVVHAHDWQAALALTWLADDGFAANSPLPRPKRVFTIHNLAYPGQYPWYWFDRLGLPPHWWHPDRLEFWNTYSSMKGGILSGRRHHHRQPHLCARDPHARLRLRAGRRAGQRGRPALGHRQRHRRPGLEPHHRPPPGGALRRRDRERRQARQPESHHRRTRPYRRGPCRWQCSSAAWRIRRGADLLVAAGPELLNRPVQLVLLASGRPGHGSSPARLGGDRAARPGSHRATPRRAPGPPPDGRRRPAADAVALRTLRTEPALRAALRRAAGGPAHRGAWRTRWWTPPPLPSPTAPPPACISPTLPSRACSTASTVVSPCGRAPAAGPALRRTGMARDSGWAASAREYLALYAGLIPRPVDAGGA